MTALDEATDLEIVLDIDLEKAVPCSFVECDNEATWRVRLLHAAGDLCESGFHCDPHKQRHAAHTEGTILYCKHQSWFCHYEWTPL